jgi:hypothetical protein
MGFLDQVKANLEAQKKAEEEKGGKLGLFEAMQVSNNAQKDRSEKIKTLKEEIKNLEIELKSIKKQNDDQKDLGEIASLEQQADDLRQRLDFQKIAANRLAEVKITTSNICEKYEVIDTVFATEVHKENLGFFGLWGGEPADPFSAFQGVIDVLKKKCIRLGGDAVINCQFNWEAGANTESFLGFTSTKKVHLIYTYGTVVKYVK